MIFVKLLLIKFQEHLEICRDQLTAWIYTGFFDGKEADRALLIKGGCELLNAVDKEDKKKEFVKNASLFRSKCDFMSFTFKYQKTEL